MLKNYFKTAYRNLLRNKGYSLINILGLSLGIACSLTLFLVIKYELSFDTHHTNVEKIWRINMHITREGETTFNSGGPSPLADAVRSEYPEIEKVSSVFYRNGGLVRVETGNKNGDRPLYQEERGFAFVQPEYFEMFDVNFKEGSSKAMAAPYNAVISESLAKKYFGNSSAINQTLLVDNQIKLNVTGVF